MAAVDDPTTDPGPTSEGSGTREHNSKLRKGSTGFIGSVLVLGGGAAVAQALVILASPIISRLFAPDAIGLAAVFTSIVTVPGLVGCLRYEGAMVLPKRDADAANLFGLCFVVMAASTVLIAVATALFSSSLLSLLNASGLLPYRWLIPIGFSIVGAALPLRYWNTRHRHFKRLAGVRLSEASTSTLGALALGFLGFTTGVHLILVRMLSLVATLLPLVYCWLRSDLAFVLRSCTLREVWRSAKRYKKFPLFSTWHELLNASSRELPTLLLTMYFGVTTAGLYAFSRRLIALPGGLIAGATSQVFLQKSAAMRAAGEDLAHPFGSVVTRLMSLGLYPMLVVAMVGPEVFRVVLGERWTEAGLYASVLSPWTFCMLIVSPLAGLWSVLERQGTALAVTIALLVFRAGALVFGGLVLRDPTQTLLLYAGVGIVFNLFTLTFFTWSVHARLTPFILHFLRCCLFAVPSTAIIASAKWYLHAADVYILVAVVLSAMPYGALILHQDREVRVRLFAAIARRHGQKR